MHKVGEIVVENGKTYIITATDGVNYAFAPYKPEEKEEEDKPKRRGRKE